MTVFLFVLIQKRVMAHFTDDVLGLMRVMYGTRVTLLSFGTREYRRITEFGPPMWQAKADTELTLSASPATAVGQILLTMPKFC